MSTYEKINSTWRCTSLPPCSRIEAERAARKLAHSALVTLGLEREEIVRVCTRLDFCYSNGTPYMPDFKAPWQRRTT